MAHAVHDHGQHAPRHVVVPASGLGEAVADMRNLEIEHYLELQRDMADILRYVTCHKLNFGAFSVRIEIELLAACAFLDSLCQGFLRSHHAAGRAFRNQGDAVKLLKKLEGNADFNIADYRVLLDPEFHLSECPVELVAYAHAYPSLMNPTPYVLTPFADWRDGKPLRWWEAFTKLKHDRIANFQGATLGSGLEALAATYVVLSLTNRPAFQGGWVSRDLYEFFRPLYWVPAGGAVPSVPTWKDR